MSPKNKLFIAILAFMLIVNILVIFNLNQFYIRAILAFVFIITIPGLLIMLALKIRNINFWEYLVYTIGLSVAFIMFAGLAVNWILPFLNITDKPLSLYPILICFDTILLILWLIAHKRNEDNAHILIFPFEEYKIKGPKSILSKIVKDKIHNSKKIINKGQSSKNQQKGISNPLDENSSAKSISQLKLLKKLKFIPKLSPLSWLDRIFIIIPFCFPFMAVIGAFLLNNHGTNIVTMIMLTSIAVYVFLVVLFRDKLNENVFPWVLWMIGLALLLSGWMRGWYLTGIDNGLEYYLFKLVNLNGFWSMKSYWNAYNAMLSLNILPMITNLFSLNDVNNYFIFKLLFQIIFSFLYIVLFLFFSKIFNKTISFLSIIFFISLPMLYSGISLGIRQEIAFLFLGLILLVLFSKEINPKIRNLFFVIFGFSMIVSHYSTAYITLAILIIFTIFSYLQNKILDKQKNNIKSRISLIPLLILIIGCFLWYMQITPTGEGATDFLKNAIQNMNNVFKEDLQAGNQGVIGNFLTVGNRQNPQEVLNDYVNGSTINYSKNDFIKPFIVNPYGLMKFNKINIFIINMKFYVEFFSRIILILGAIILLLFKDRANDYYTDEENFLFYRNLSLVSLLVGGIFMILPFFSINYDLSRFYNQIVLITSPLLVLGFLIIPKINNKNKFFYLFVSLFIIFYFLNIGGLFLALNNNPEVSMRFANYGREYNHYNIYKGEECSFSWVIKEKNLNEIRMDSRMKSRSSFLIGPDKNLKVITSILTTQLNKGQIFLSGYINKFYNFAWISYKSYWMSVNLPTEFLNDNKNKIYNNGGSEIFK